LAGWHLQTRFLSREVHALSQNAIDGNCSCYVIRMLLADRVAQCRAPFLVRDNHGGRLWRLDNTADHAEQVRTCPTRYVLADDLTRLCADLAYSKGARTVGCADLLHIPAVTLWIEWCNRPWQQALQHYGFPLIEGGCQWIGRRGALIKSSPDGRRGVVRTFWTAGGSEEEVLASSLEAFFDFDAQEGEDPEPPDGDESLQAIQVRDEIRADGDDVLARCFRFRYQRSWSEYYGKAGLAEAARYALWRHTLGTIAVDIPMLLAFVLLLSTRSGLPHRTSNNERLNRGRQKSCKTPLLDHIHVRAPLLPEYIAQQREDQHGTRRGPRLHRVRGHLVRRGSSLFWRVPHLRGSARAGSVKSRTVVWTFDKTRSGITNSSQGRPPRPSDPGAARLSI